LGCRDNISIKKDDAGKLVAAVANMSVSAANEIQNIVSEGDTQNNAGGELPPILPMQLVKIEMRRPLSL
jgi:hypothetical protein